MKENRLILDRIKNIKTKIHEENLILILNNKKY